MSLEQLIANLTERIDNRYYGKYRGFVVDNSDPKNLGRLRVRVPALLGNDVVTGWSTPCVPFGGLDNQGLFFIPDPGAGVWIEFEQGDLDHPVWVGTFWSEPGGTPESPRTNDADAVEVDQVQSPPTSKILKTGKGHTIQLEDQDDNEMVIILENQNGHYVRMNKDGIIIKDGTNEHEIMLGSDGIMLKSSAGVIIEADGDIEIKGTSVKVEATGQLTGVGSPIHLNP